MARRSRTGRSGRIFSLDFVVSYYDEHGTRTQNLDKFRVRMNKLPIWILNNFRDDLEEIARNAVEIIRDRIMNSPDSTDNERYDTGDMYNGVTYRLDSSPGGKTFTLSVGWVRTGSYQNAEPKYAIFQEYGTRRGIIAMNSLQEAELYIRDEVAKLQLRTTVNESR